MRIVNIYKQDEMYSVNETYFKYISNSNSPITSTKLYLTEEEYAVFNIALSNNGAKYINAFLYGSVGLFRSTAAIEDYIETNNLDDDIESAERCKKVRIEIMAQFLYYTDIGPASTVSRSLIKYSDFSSVLTDSEKLLYNFDTYYAVDVLLYKHQEYTTEVTMLYFEKLDDCIVAYNTDTGIIYLRLSWFMLNDPIHYYRYKGYQEVSDDTNNAKHPIVNKDTINSLVHAINYSYAAIDNIISRVRNSKHESMKKKYKKLKILTFDNIAFNEYFMKYTRSFTILDADFISECISNNIIIPYRFNIKNVVSTLVCNVDGLVLYINEKRIDMDKMHMILLHILEYNNYAINVITDELYHQS